jgi:DNA polymerase I
MPNERIILIDGNSLIYRAFFALSSLTSSTGQSTNAVYGFANMLFKLLEDEKPDYIAVAMDVGKTTFRNDEYAEYKATRQETPEDLLSQFPIIREFLAAMRIPVLEKEGFEADDVIGTLSAHGDQHKLETLIVTGDRDALQLISSSTNVLLTRKGISDMERYSQETVMAKFGVQPWQLIEVKGLMGDSSDNIPGVPGIGEKTALKLIREYETIDGVLAHLDRLSGKKLQENLQDYAPQALLSKKLATIVRDVPVAVDFTALKRQDPDYDSVLELFRRLGFRTLTARVEKMSGEPAPLFAQAEPLVDRSLVLTGERLTALKDQKAPVAVALQGHDIYLKGQEAEVYRLTGQDQDPDLTAALGKLLADPGISKYIWQAKFIYKQLAARDIHCQSIRFDPMIAAYLLDPGKNRYELADMAAEFLNTEALPAGLSIPEQEVSTVQKLAPPMFQKLKEFEQLPLLEKMEMPLAIILAKMEMAGIRVDQEQLQQMGAELDKKIAALADQIYAHAGQEFNINSPRQLGEILFEKLNLPVGRKTKTGYSTDVDVLTGLARKHPIAELILEYRQLVKLRGTYVDGLLGLINPDTHRIHTTFNQTVTTTGRISSTEPNLQNIPIRSEVGREIRKAFAAGIDGWQILAADYSQIELRVLAHLSGDETLSESFRNEEDIHARTASEVFGVPIAEVTTTLRGKAKAVNFGIIYGISDYGLSMNLRISREEAKTYIDNYFARYPKVKEYMDQTIAAARDKGYVTTIFHRRRYLPDLHSRNFNVRSFAERTAMNTPIQGSAADIIKMAMVRVQNRLETEKRKARMLLQVHDELIFEVPQDEVAAVTRLVKEEMENAFPLDVPLQVDIGTGPNWYDVKKV